MFEIPRENLEIENKSEVETKNTVPKREILLEILGKLIAVHVDIEHKGVPELQGGLCLVAVLLRE